MHKLRISHLAERDIVEAKAWYGKENRVLVRRFSSNLNQAFDRILDNPYLYARIFHDLRRAVMHDFPYSIFYRVHIDDIHVKAVWHDHRNPESWQKRLV